MNTEKQLAFFEWCMAMNRLQRMNMDTATDDEIQFAWEAKMKSEKELNALVSVDGNAE